MKHRKRILAMALTVLLAGALLCACGGVPETPPAEEDQVQSQQIQAAEQRRESTQPTQATTETSTVPVTIPETTAPAATQPETTPATQPATEPETTPETTPETKPEIVKAVNPQADKAPTEKATDFTAYHDQVVAFITHNGVYDRETGAYWLGFEMESENYDFDYYLTNLDGKIWLEGIIQPKSGAGHGVYTNLYLARGDARYITYSEVWYYDYGQVAEYFPIDNQEYRKDLTGNTDYTLSGNHGIYISLEQATEWFNNGLSDIMPAMDEYLYQHLGFGIKYLGFYNHEGYGSDPEVTLPGDFTGDGSVTNDDVTLLMWHVLFPEENPIVGSGDLDGDGKVTNDDVTKLMWFVLFPDENPL